MVVFLYILHNDDVIGLHRFHILHDLGDAVARVQVRNIGMLLWAVLLHLHWREYSGEVINIQERKTEYLKYKNEIIAKFL